MEVREPKRFVLLDFYRFIAALGVFIFHLKNIDKGISPAWNGSYGLFVDMFFILSGFAFPIAAMPRLLQWFTLVNPLRYFLVVIRAVFLKGVGFAVLWPQLGALAGLAAVMLLLSVLRFRASLQS